MVDIRAEIFDESIDHNFYQKNSFVFFEAMFISGHQGTGRRGKMLDFFDFSSFFYGSEISGKQTNSKKNFKNKYKSLRKVIWETSSVSISSKLVDIFGLKALCTKAWQKNRTLKRDFKEVSKFFLYTWLFCFEILTPNGRKRLQNFEVTF